MIFSKVMKAGLTCWSSGVSQKHVSVLLYHGKKAQTLVKETASTQNMTAKDNTHETKHPWTFLMKNKMWNAKC